MRTRTGYQKITVSDGVVVRKLRRLHVVFVHVEIIEEAKFAIA